MGTRFGISSHLFHGQRLGRAHIAAIAAHGFEVLELFATRTHVDYRDPAALRQLGDWLAGAGVALHAVHAPTTRSFTNGMWGETLSVAAVDEAQRRAAVDETRAALALAQVVPFDVLVLHLGVPSADPAANSRAAVARSLEEIGEATAGAGVRLALELIPNGLSSADRLVRWIEDDLDLPGVGICLDVGHAHLGGDAMEAIEACSGHIVTTHLHDNRGRRDDHLVPGQGTVDWDGVMMAFQKVGYDGAWIFELAPAAEPEVILAEAARARARLTRLLAGEA